MTLSKAMITALLPLCLYACSNGGKDGEKRWSLDSMEQERVSSAADSTSIFSNTVSLWLDSSLKKHQPYRKLTLEEQWKDDSLSPEKIVLERSFFTDYSTVLRWSPDSTYVLDMGSYGAVPIKDKYGTTKLETGDPDTEIALLNIKRNERTRLIFVGPSAKIISGRWLSMQDVLVLGTFKTDNGNTDTLLWSIDVVEQFFRLYNVKTGAR